MNRRGFISRVLTAIVGVAAAPSLAKATVCQPAPTRQPFFFDPVIISKGHTVRLPDSPVGAMFTIVNTGQESVKVFAREEQIGSVRVSPNGAAIFAYDGKRWLSLHG